jgi:hypothetical protein
VTNPKVQVMARERAEFPAHFVGTVSRQTLAILWRPYHAPMLATLEPQFIQRIQYLPGQTLTAVTSRLVIETTL